MKPLSALMSACAAIALTLTVPFATMAATANGKWPDAAAPLIGSWTGSGSARASATAKTVPITCRARYRFTNGKLMTTVTCSGTQQSSQLVAYIASANGGDRLTGSWYRSYEDTRGEEHGTVQGHVRGKVMRLDVYAGGSMRGKTTITIGARRHRVEVIGAGKNGANETLQATFRR